MWEQEEAQDKLQEAGVRTPRDSMSAPHSEPPGPQRQEEIAVGKGRRCPAYQVL